MTDAIAVPSGDLIWRVAGHRDAQLFLAGGEQSRRDLERALAVVDHRLADFDRILDFGCGCGRVIRWMGDLDGRITGIDIDPDAIAWAREHIPFADFQVNPWVPPTELGDGEFDLVTNHSVFTHLDEHHQDLWLAELHRITRPGGVLVLSASTSLPFAGYEKMLREAGVDPSPARRRIESEGILFIEDDGWVGGPFPDFYHSTFHAPWYLIEHWQRWFDLLAYLPQGNLGFQDTLVLRRPGDDERVPVVGTASPRP